MLAPGPLVHSLSLYAAAATLFAGATVHIVQKFTAPNVLDVIFAQSITDLYVVPTMFEALYEESLKRGQSLVTTSSVRSIISTGDKWSALSKRKVKMVFPGASLFEFYGASELSFVTILDPDGNQRRPDSVGKPVENVTISIRDAEGKEVQRGEAGTLYVQSPMLFAGYYMGNTIASESSENGWVTVGDIAKQDEEGFVYIVGRKNNMLISGGLNIYPQEIEEVLLQIPSIHESLVIGVPDTHWGEKIVALVKLKPEATLEEDTVKMYCRDHLATYKCPKEIRQVEVFPYTQSGKIARQVMREQFTWRQTNHE
ncbi:MAG TPA: AMP-binding protein [Ktedonobacteraceae bacterium]|nr:AMP-binding protein [Ktedonobacteraceae bacterium]